MGSHHSDDDCSPSSQLKEHSRQQMIHLGQFKRNPVGKWEMKRDELLMFLPTLGFQAHAASPFCRELQTWLRFSCCVILYPLSHLPVQDLILMKIIPWVYRSTTIGALRWGSVSCPKVFSIAALHSSLRSWTSAVYPSIHPSTVGHLSTRPLRRRQHSFLFHLMHGILSLPPKLEVM